MAGQIRILLQRLIKIIILIYWEFDLGFKIVARRDSVSLRGVKNRNSATDEQEAFFYKAGLPRVN
jgi:hypothetical protein